MDARQRAMAEQVKRAMFDHTKPFTTCLVFEDHKGDMGSLGTGSYFRYLNSAHLLTAGHVAFEGNYFQIGHSIQREAEPYAVNNSWDILGNAPEWDLDLATVEIEPTHLDLPEDWHDFQKILRTDVPLARYGKTTDDIESDWLWLCGYPKYQQTPMPILKRRYSKPVGVLVACSQRIPSGLDTNVFGVVDYQIQADPNTGKPINPQGFSGALVWDTCRAKKGKEWTAFDAKVIGVVARYYGQNPNGEDPIGFRGLIAFTRIEVVREFLLGYLRRKAAYYRWVANGCPEASQLADWVHAEAAIPNI